MVAAQLVVMQRALALLFSSMAANKPLCHSESYVLFYCCRRFQELQRSLLQCRVPLQARQGRRCLHSLHHSSRRQCLRSVTLDT